MEILLLILCIFNFIAIATVSVFLYMNIKDVDEIQTNVKTLQDTTAPDLDTRLTAVESSEGNKEYVMAKMAQIDSAVSAINTSLTTALNNYTSTNNENVVGALSYDAVPADLTAAGTQIYHVSSEVTGTHDGTSYSKTSTDKVINTTNKAIPNQAMNIRTVANINAQYARFMALVEEAKVLYKVAEAKSFKTDVQASYDKIIGYEAALTPIYQTKILGISTTTTTPTA